MSEENQAPVFSIEKTYVKDLSVELPNAPQVFLEQTAPEIGVQLHSAGEPIAEGVYEVVLTVTVTAKLPEDKTAFLVEVGQAGIFQIHNVPEEELDPILGVACPNILFPFAREVVADAVTRAGFPPVLLSPINFESIYEARRVPEAAEPTLQ